jgi:hypothetical protein
MWFDVTLSSAEGGPVEDGQVLWQNVTSYVIPEACPNITYSIVSAKRDALRDASSICKTRVTSVTVMDMT